MHRIKGNLHIVIIINLPAPNGDVLQKKDLGLWEKKLGILLLHRVLFILSDVDIQIDL